MSEDFPMQALLRARCAARDEAARVFATATAALHAAIAALSDHEERHAALADQIRAARTVDLGAALDELRRNDEYVRALEVERDDVARELQQQERVVAARRRGVDEAKLALRRAEIELEAVELRRREWDRACNRARRNRDDAELDEVALRRWRETTDDEP